MATQPVQTEAEKQAAAAEAEAAKVKAAAEALTPEQQEAQTQYNRAKLLHASNYGPDPDKDVVHMPDGTDERGRPKLKEWDFRKPAEAAAEERTETDATETETDEERVAREAKEAEDTLAAERKKKEAAAAAKKKKAATTTAPVAPAAPQPDPEEIAQRTAEAVVERMAPKAGTTTTTTAKPAEETFSTADQRVLAVLQGMEELDGYQGIVAATREFWRKEKGYREKWETEHPDQVYDRAAGEHSAWYEKNNPEFKHPEFDADFETVQQEQAAERVISKRLGKREQELQAREQRYTTNLRMREEAQEVAGLSQAGKVEFLKNVLPEAVSAVAGEGEFELTPETVAKLNEHATPVQLKVVDELADELGLVLQELERLTRYAGSYRPNPDWKVELQTTKKEFYPHRELLQFANWLEAAVGGDPNNRRDGKQFLPTSEYQEKVGAILNGNGNETQKRGALHDLEKRFYRLTADDVRDAYITECGHRAGKRIKELSDLVEATTVKKNGAGKTSLAAQQAAAAATHVEAENKPRRQPPASTSASDRVNVKASKDLSDDERLALMGRNF